MLYKDPFYSHVSWMTILKAIIIGWRARSALSTLYTFNLYHKEIGQGQAETSGCFRKANLLPPKTAFFKCLFGIERDGTVSPR